jgi:hypothetical protein
MQKNDPESTTSYQCQWRYLADKGGMRRQPCLPFLNGNLTDKNVELG